MLKLTHTNTPPTMTNLPQNGEDQFHTALLGPEARDGYSAPLLLDKGSLKQVGGSDAFVMHGRTTQVEANPSW